VTGAPSRDDAVRRLRAAYRQSELTLYVGAGASIESGLPTWQGLLTGIFLNSLTSISESGELPLLQATAETWCQRAGVPLEIWARELRASFAPEEFMKWLRFALYKWIDCNPSGTPSRRFIVSLRRNRTLSALATMCSHTRFREVGLKRVVTYNLDNLLELRLGTYPHESVWAASPSRPTSLPIYHVHGFLPARFPWVPYRSGTASLPDQIVLTEDQYHRQTTDHYSWANLIQLSSMSDTVGLTVGLSMSDPNMRRLLDISRATNSRPEVYALLPPVVSDGPRDQDVDTVVTRTEELLRRGHPWLHDGVQRRVTKGKRIAARTSKIWLRLDSLAVERNLKVMRELNIHPVWCEHSEIPGIIDQIVRAKPTAGKARGAPRRAE